MKRIVLSLIVAILFFFNIENITSAQTFKDVKPDYWAKPEIEYLVDNQITIGYLDGRFGINDKITRLQASTMIVRALKLDLDNRPAPDLKDVNSSMVGYAVISAIVDEGIMNGNEYAEFKPSATLTRGQMASILVKAFELQGESAYSFRDIEPSYWATSAIKTLFNNNITTGYPDNTFKPYSPITRAHFAVFLARALNPNFIQITACDVRDNTAKYYVDVAVTTLWSEPNKTRKIDQSSIAPQVDLVKWTNSMTIPQKSWLVGKIETQALFGQEVVILQNKEDWLEIAVKDQYSPKNKNGYPGWVPKSHITEVYPNYATCEKAIISKPTATLFNYDQTKSIFMSVSMNTILPVIKEDETWYQVQTPKNGIKFLRKQDAKVFSTEKTIPIPTRQDIVNTAKEFLGLPYLWAGTSGFGLDCSGFTYTVYRQHGIDIPRDSTVQASHGTAVLKSNLKPGDLLFFAHNNGKGKVHHVGMYIGDGNMIHSPNPKKTVEIISINAQPYQAEFSGARSYLK